MSSKKESYTVAISNNTLVTVDVSRTNRSQFSTKLVVVNQSNTCSRVTTVRTDILDGRSRIDKDCGTIIGIEVEQQNCKDVSSILIEKRSVKGTRETSSTLTYSDLIKVTSIVVGIVVISTNGNRLCSTIVIVISIGANNNTIQEQSGSSSVTSNRNMLPGVLSERPTSDTICTALSKSELSSRSIDCRSSITCPRSEVHQNLSSCDRSGVAPPLNTEVSSTETEVGLGSIVYTVTSTVQQQRACAKLLDSVVNLYVESRNSSLAALNSLCKLTLTFSLKVDIGAIIRCDGTITICLFIGDVTTGSTRGTMGKCKCVCSYCCDLEESVSSSTRNKVCVYTVILCETVIVVGYSDSRTRSSIGTRSKLVLKLVDLFSSSKGTRYARQFQSGSTCTKGTSSTLYTLDTFVSEVYKGV